MDFVCVECGKSCSNLYQKPPSGIIKMSFCENCKQTVDKYVTYDSSVILLDVLLHKSQVYRHLLFNITTPSIWKLFVVLLVCDAYMKWDGLHSNSESSDPIIFYAALELDFYRMFLLAFIEWACFASVMCVLIRFQGQRSLQPKHVLHGLVVSSFGKLLVVPAIIWAQTHSSLYLWLTQLLVFTSNVTALRVLSRSRHAVTVTIVTIAWLSQYATKTFLQRFADGGHLYDFHNA